MFEQSGNAPERGKPYRMKPLNEGNVLEALRSVKDPDLHRDIVSLNFVKDVAIRGKDVSFTIELTTPACPVREELKVCVRTAVRESIEGVGNVTRRDDLQRHAARACRARRDPAGGQEHDRGGLREGGGREVDGRRRTWRSPWRWTARRSDWSMPTSTVRACP